MPSSSSRQKNQRAKPDNVRLIRSRQFSRTRQCPRSRQFSRTRQCPGSRQFSRTRQCPRSRQFSRTRQCPRSRLWKRTRHFRRTRQCLRTRQCPSQQKLSHLEIRQTLRIYCVMGKSRLERVWTSTWYTFCLPSSALLKTARWLKSTLDPKIPSLRSQKSRLSTSGLCTSEDTSMGSRL